jgi:hypothetical protein
VLPEARHRLARRPRQDQHRRHRHRPIGKLDGKEKTLYIYNICDHEDAYHETGNQAVSYTTGVPAMIGAAMMLTGACGAARACSTWSSSIPIRSWTCSTSMACRGR